MKKTFHILTIASLLLGTTGVCNAAWADSSSAEVRLVATINNGPAFQPITWKVFRVDGKGETYQSDRHAFTIDSLTPGRYTAIAKRNGQTERKRDFYVMADTTNKINIPVD
ncbi:hypothetical protein [uncultured Thiothrix sp.]|uniref:hypothetical protein n=1 Tax=uncultured Thiothrix sp. TaxID=223185 RepID=UPI002616F7AB|nr:hypothetical protein [uncultured Thiothrix sp.]